MKQVVLLLFAAVFLTSSSFAQKSLADVDVKTLEGKTVDLKEYVAKSGKVIIISFWATWCAPCKRELDVLAELYDDWQKDFNVEIIAISIDNQRALPKVPAMVQSKAWPFTIFSGNEEEMRAAFNFQTIPQTYVIDKGGAIVYEHNGYLPGDELELEKAAAKAANKVRK